MKFLRSVLNWVVYGKWTPCSHEKWQAVLFADWECVDCGVSR